MSYNIRLGIQKGLPDIADVINAHQPDILALQEVGHFWNMGPPADTSSQLSALCHLPYVAFFPTIRRLTPRARPSYYGHALMSRWPIIATQRHDLTRVDDEPRVIGISTVLSPEHPVAVLSTHLSHLEPDRSLHGVELLGAFARLRRRATPCVLLGDLNEASPTCSWRSALLANAQDAASLDPSPTFPAMNPKRRIDYLLADRGAWRDYRVVEEPDASDHRPVVAHWQPNP